MDVNSLYTNIPQEEGINTICKAYESFYKNDTPIPTHSLAGLLRLILQENSFQIKGKNYLQTHPTVKVMAEISDIETNFLDTTVFKGERFHKDSILDISTYFKPTEKFQYMHYTSCHAPGVKKGFIKGEALRLLGTNSSETKFEENICNFKSNLCV